MGRVGWEKGLNYLFEAVPRIQEELDDFKVVLAGPYQDVLGDNSFKKLKPLINKFKDRIVLLGPVEHEKLVNFYEICDCLVLPSTNNLETFGIVQAEAMVCGCPVVASNLPGVRVPVNLTKMGEIAQVADSQSLANKIVKVLRKKVTNEQRENSKKIFSVKKFVQSYMDLFSGK